MTGSSFSPDRGVVGEGYRKLNAAGLKKDSRDFLRLRVTQNIGQDRAESTLYLGTALRIR